MTNYGKIDVLWYDVDWPLDAAGWESERMNKMVFGLQPDIIVNNRNGLPGDFSTPEQEIVAEKGSRSWESCMTLNDSWGYHRADDNWKSPKTVIRNLVSCSRDGGNYLLNIGPKPDGSIPEESVRVLTEVGQWMSRNGGCHSHDGSLPGTRFRVCGLYTPGQYALHARSFLARRYGCFGRFDDESKIGTAFCFRP